MIGWARVRGGRRGKRNESGELERERAEIGDPSQIDGNKEASEKQPHPFCLNRRKG